MRARRFLILVIFVAAVFSVVVLVGGEKSGSCKTSDGNVCKSVSKDGCYCDSECTKFADCCADYQQVCGNAPVCGDGICSQKERCQTDCPTEPSSSPLCGNGICEPQEKCAKDCVVKTDCGNGVCESGENAGNCQSDCGIVAENVVCVFLFPTYPGTAVDSKGVPIVNSKGPPSGQYNPDGSLATHSCYSSQGESCSGFSSCAINVQSQKGKVLTWKSECTGNPVTTMDGNQEVITFFCGTPV